MTFTVFLLHKTTYRLHNNNNIQIFLHYNKTATRTTHYLGNTEVISQDPGLITVLHSEEMGGKKELGNGYFCCADQLHLQQGRGREE